MPRRGSIPRPGKRHTQPVRSPLPFSVSPVASGARQSGDRSDLRGSGHVHTRLNEQGLTSSPPRSTAGREIIITAAENQFQWPCLTVRIPGVGPSVLSARQQEVDAPRRGRGRVPAQLATRGSSGVASSLRSLCSRRSARILSGFGKTVATDTTVVPREARTQPLRVFANRRARKGLGVRIAYPLAEGQTP